MFALIIAIVSIALIVATIAATMYHGGDTLTQGRDRATAAGIVSGAQQVGGAAVMFLSLEGARAGSVDALVTGNYLSSEPISAGYFTIAGTGARTVTSTLAADQDGVCTAINQSAGAAAPEAVDAAALADLPYGCVNATRAFSFNY